MTQQEPDPPDPRAAIHAAIRLLRDVADRLEEPRDPTADEELRLRALALRAAMIRAYAHMSGG